MPKAVGYLIMVLSGVGILWYIQVLWVLSALLVLLRKIEKDRLYAFGEKAALPVLFLLVIPVWGAAQILNTPVICVYRFGIYAVSYTHLVKKNEYIGDMLDVHDIRVGETGENVGFDTEKGIIVGNIRMGFGHYRISMAIASAAHSMGYVPYWMDLNSYPQTTCTKVIGAQNDLYSLGSRLSQKSRLFNRLVWEPMNYEGFRKLSYNAADQKNAELMAPVYANVPKEIPVVATHVWPCLLYTSIRG